MINLRYILRQYTFSHENAPVVLSRIISLRPGLALLKALCCSFACTACGSMPQSSCCIFYHLAGGPQSNHDSKRYKCRTWSFPPINIHIAIPTACVCVVSDVVIHCTVSGQRHSVLRVKQSSVCGTCLISVASIKKHGSAILPCSSVPS